MLNLYSILIIISLYFLSVFLILRIIVPFMGFRKPKLPENVPLEIIKTIEDLKHKSNSPYSYLKLAYDWRAGKWHTDAMKTIPKAALAFKTDLNFWLSRPGLAHCTTINYILYILLVRGGYFQKDDIKFKHTMQNFFIHQYLQVRVDGEWIDVDTSSTGTPELPMGKRKHLFGR